MKKHFSLFSYVVKRLVLVWLVFGLMFQSFPFSLLTPYVPDALKDPLAENLFTQRAQAMGQYFPTGGTLVVGSETAVTNGGTSGNLGSWRALLAQDATSPGFGWVVDFNTGSGLDQEVIMDGVALNGANKFEIHMRVTASVNTVSRFYQICD